MPDVYGTALGRVRARLASPARRPLPGAAPRRASSPSRGCSRGCGSSTSAAGRWACGDWSPARHHGRRPRAASEYPGPFVLADATERLPFDDGAFDLAYARASSSTSSPADRRAFAAEIRRVARGWFVQTPAWSFPIEPHALLPIAHWLPPPLRRPLLAPGRRRGAGRTSRLLRRAELVALFGEPILAERMGGLVKSWIALRAVDRARRLNCVLARVPRRRRPGAGGASSCLPNGATPAARPTRRATSRPCTPHRRRRGLVRAGGRSALPHRRRRARGGGGRRGHRTTRHAHTYWNPRAEPARYLLVMTGGSPP